MYDNNQFVGQGLADEAITAFSIVSQSGVADKLNLAGANEAALGIGPDYAVADDHMVMYTAMGVTQLKLAGTVLLTDMIVSDAAGQGVAAALVGTTVQNIVGIPLRAGVSGDIIPVMVRPFKHRPALV